MSIRTFTATAAVSACALVAASSPARAELIYAILNNDPSVGQTLATIDTNTRAVTSSVILQGGVSLGSIDVRPATGELYGIGLLNTQLYKINPNTGAATTVGGALPATGLIDFNPTVDAIRLVSGTSNYRVNPTTGALIAQDGDLAYKSGDIYNGETPQVVGIGYTNSVAGATATRLYEIDGSKDTLIYQEPANAGTLTTQGLLGFNANTGLFGGGFNGFDISGQTGVAYLTDSSFGSPTTLYTIDLPTGIAINRGTIMGLSDIRSVAEIAVAPVPEPGTLIAAAALSAGLMGRRRRVAHASTR